MTFLFVYCSTIVIGQDDTLKKKDSLRLTFEQLTQMTITTSSKYKEKIEESTTTIIVITEEQIKKRGYTDLTQVIQDLPGMDVIIRNGSNYSRTYTRGNRTELAERILLFVDGVNYQSLGFQNMHLSRGFPISSIEKIEVLYGPSSAIYGPDAFTGVINIFTKKAKSGEKHAYSTIGTGSYNTSFHDYTFIGKSKDFGVTLSFMNFQSDEPDYSERDGFFSNEIIETSWKPMADKYGSYEDPTDNYTVLAKLNYKTLHVGFINSSTSEGSGPEYPLDKTMPSPQWKEYQNLAYIKHELDIGQKLNLNSLISFKNGDTPPNSVWAQRYDYDTDTLDPGYGNADVNLGHWQFYNVQYSISEDFVYKLNTTSIINGGVNFSYNDFQKGYQINWGEWVEDYEDSYTNYSTPPSITTDENRRYKMNTMGAYIQLKQFLFGKKMTITSGIRFDQNNIYDDVFNPRIGMMYKIRKNWIFKTNYGTGFQYPSPRNLYGGWEGTSVSSLLKPERINAFEGSTMFSLNRNFWNEVSSYFNVIENTNFQGVNLPTSQIFGIEYKGGIYIPTLSSRLKDLELFYNYTYTDPKYKKPVTASTTGRSSRRIGDIPTHKFNIGIGGKIFNILYLSVKNNFIGKRPTVVSNPIHEVATTNITNLHFSVNKSVKDLDFSISLIVNNLLDVDYYHPGMVDGSAGEDTSQESLGWYSSRIPQPGRNFMLVLKTNF